MVGGCSLAMVSLSPKLCLVSFATFPAAVLLSRHMGKRIKARQRAVQEALAAAAEAHSALLNVRTLRLFAAERLASERYDERVRAARDEAATAGLYAAAVESGVGLAMQSSLLSVLAVGGQQVLSLTASSPPSSCTPSSSASTPATSPPHTPSCAAPPARRSAFSPSSAARLL